MNREHLANIAETVYAKTMGDNPSMNPKEYRGLYGEVVLSDGYHLKKIKFDPDVIFDVGANIGVFSLFAHSLFSDAKIVAVEPQAINYSNLQRAVEHIPQIKTINAALGVGQVYKFRDHLNGAHACFITDPENPDIERLSLSEVPSVSLAELVSVNVSQGQRYALKIDCEGNENTIFHCEPSRKALFSSHYFAMEIHHSINTGTGSHIRRFLRYARRHYLIEWNENNTVVYGTRKDLS